MFEVGDIVDCVTPRTKLPKGRYLVLSVDQVRKCLHISPIKIERTNSGFEDIIGGFMWARFVKVKGSKIKRNLPAWF